MEPLKSLKALNEMLLETLTAISPEMITQLIYLLNGATISMQPGYTKREIAAFNFEYRHEWLSMVFFGSDERGVIITEIQTILHSELADYLAQSEEIMDGLEEAEGNFESEAWETLMEEYEEEKYELYDSWFEACWKEAYKLAPNNTPAYFSIDELDFGIILNTSEMIAINKNLPNMRYYIY